jgi:hypothetical protein
MLDFVLFGISQRKLKLIKCISGLEQVDSDLIIVVAETLIQFQWLVLLGMLTSIKVNNWSSMC